MRRPHDDDSLTEDERLCEIASILAAGVLRLRQRAALQMLEGAGSELPRFR